MISGCFKIKVAGTTSLRYLCNAKNSIRVKAEFDKDLLIIYLK